MPSSLHNVWLIAKREYLERVRTRAFLIATILIPVLMGGFVFASGYLGAKTKSNAHIAVVSADRAVRHRSQAPARNRQALAHVRGHLRPVSRHALRHSMKYLKNKNGIAGYLWVTPALDRSTSAQPLPTSRARPETQPPSTFSTTPSRQCITREELTHTGVASKDIDNLLAPVDIDTSATGDSKAAYSAALVLFLLMYMVIMLYGMNTARSIIEEKTSRVFEVLLSTIKPDEMLAGKILGVGAVGLTQIGVWMLAAIILGSTGLAAGLLGSGKLPISTRTGHLLRRLLPLRLPRLFVDRRRTRRHDQLRTGTPAAQHVPRPAARLLHADALRHRHRTQFHVVDGRLAHPVLQPAADEPAHLAHHRSSRGKSASASCSCR